MQILQRLPSILLQLFPLGFLSLAVLPLFGCTVVEPAGPPTVSSGGSSIAISPAARSRIGQKIWTNECGRTVDGLTSWNVGEGFASLGIGHFIWYPVGVSGPYDESFPGLVRFCLDRKVAVPAWVRGAKDCPWATKSEFEAARAGAQMGELRRFLAATVDVQTDYIVARLEAALPKLMASSRPELKDQVRSQFYAVAESPQGIYALVDYVNFKGEGTKTSERYRGEGWGMLQVLEGMRPGVRGSAAAVEFGESAKRVLTRRVSNAPRDESRWLAGWKNRCSSYGKPL